MTYNEYRKKLIKLGMLINRAYWEGRYKVFERLEAYRSDFMDQFPEYNED